MPVLLNQRARLLIATIWVGSLWTVGYLVAPTLFATLFDRTLAGTIAGSLFRVQTWVSLACGIALIALLRMGTQRAQEQAVKMQAKTLLNVIIGMLSCALLMQFGLQPLMASLRASAATVGGVMNSDLRMQFGLLHGASSLIYMIESVLGVALILKIR
ncbi:DUF4149 domain-containing protein [Undibacterium arcticum]|uniref:DUF4149 domain-containing protein n=2 Tax=Undibacterium arcticum TaxID=1762892 RepID=A0ABV7EXG6_9BURK